MYQLRSKNKTVSKAPETNTVSKAPRLKKPVKFEPFVQKENLSQKTTGCPNNERDVIMDGKGNVPKDVGSIGKNSEDIRALRAWLNTSVNDVHEHVSQARPGLNQLSKQRTVNGKSLRKFVNGSISVGINPSKVSPLASSNVLSEDQPPSSPTIKGSVKCTPNVKKKVATGSKMCNYKPTVNKTPVITSLMKNNALNNFTPIFRDSVCESGSDASTPISSNVCKEVAKENLFGFEKLLVPERTIHLEQCKVSPITNASEICDKKEPLRKASDMRRRRSPRKQMKPSKSRKQFKYSPKKYSPDSSNPEDKSSKITLFCTSSEADDCKARKGTSLQNLHPEMPSTKTSTVLRGKKTKSWSKPLVEPVIPWADIMSHELVIE